MILDKCAGCCLGQRSLLLLPSFIMHRNNSAVGKDEGGLHTPQTLDLLPSLSSSQFDTHSLLCWIRDIGGLQRKEAGKETW